MAEAKKFNQTEKEIIKNAAKVAGQSVNEFVVRAVRNSIKKANLEK
jgi:uncharacterized protein (DUF1778 family)